jgi:sulfide:quinone oxidoreductase
MDLRPLSEDFAVAPQIAPEEVPRIAEAGYRSVLCNRPDDEEPGQPSFDAVAEAARAAGMEARCVPIVSGQVTPQSAEDFRAALDQMPKPILAYCRSGTRCTVLWSLTRHGDMDTDEILRRTRAAGYDMSGLIRQLEGG